MFLALFLVVSYLDLSLLSDPSAVLDRGGLAAALLGTGLLIADVVLPVPSSLIMIAHGALFGLIAGTALSLVGGLDAALTGFWIGRRGTGLIRRFVDEEEHLRADRLMQQWGMIAINVTRPIPLLAETVSIVAGSTSMRYVVMQKYFGNPVGMTLRDGWHGSWVMSHWFFDAIPVTDANPGAKRDHEEYQISFARLLSTS